MNELEWPARGRLPGSTRAEPCFGKPPTPWVADRIDLYEDDRQLRGHALVAFVASLPSDTSFDAFDRALAHVTGDRRCRPTPRSRPRR